MSIPVKISYNNIEKIVYFLQSTSSEDIESKISFLYGIPNGNIYFSEEELGIITLDIMPTLLSKLENRTLTLCTTPLLNQHENQSLSQFDIFTKSRSKFKPYPQSPKTTQISTQPLSDSIKSKKNEKCEKDISVNISFSKRIKGQKGAISPKKFIRVSKSTTFTQLKQMVVSKFECETEPESIHIYSIRGEELDEDTWNVNDYVKGNFQFLFDLGTHIFLKYNLIIEKKQEFISSPIIESTQNEIKSEKKRKNWRETKQRQRAKKKQVL